MTARPSVRESRGFFRQVWTFTTAGLRSVLCGIGATLKDAGTKRLTASAQPPASLGCRPFTMRMILGDTHEIIRRTARDPERG